MAHDDTAPEGPDLERGVPSAELAADAPLTGHVGGEPVLLVRHAGRLHALGARCPHYGAPLGEGLVVAGTIRCPWHHAAFDLATGRCERPPALADLPCWRVEERDGIARVTERRAAPPADPARSARPATRARAPGSVVVIGGGAAGLAAVATLRREGYAGPVTMVSEERTPPVDRPNLSKDYLAGTAEEDWIPLRPAEWYDEQGVTLRTGARAARIDPGARRVELADGSALPYDALLLATGAAPIRLPLGDGLPVHYLRTFDDSRAIVRAASGARRAAVLGASFIGLEVAASLRARGLEVTVIAPEAVPLERVLGPELGGVVRALHEDRGVRFRLGRTARETDARGVVLDDGSRVDADFVVAGVGVRPNLSLAEEAGLATERGVLVDEYLETSAPGIFAAGDIARWPDPHTGARIRVEHWVVAERQGRAAALNVLGARERFDAVPFFWSAHYDATISYVGHAERPERVEVEGDPASLDCAVRYVEGGRVVAVATIGRDRASLAAEAGMERALRDAQPRATGVA